MRRTMLALGLLVAAGMLMTQLAAEKADKPAKPSGGPAIGSPAPEFSLQDQTGKTVSLADYKGKIVVLEWFNEECPYVVKWYSQGDMNKLAEKYASQDVVWLAVNSTSSKDNAANAKIAESWKIIRPVLNDSAGEAFRAYRATNTPHMFIIDKEGKLAYKGAIDSNRSSKQADIAGATNYVGKALDEMLAGKTVSDSETKAYGCSIKNK